MSDEAQELCMRRDYFQIISGEGMGMEDMFFILLENILLHGVHQLLKSPDVLFNRGHIILLYGKH